MHLIYWKYNIYNTFSIYFHFIRIVGENPVEYKVEVLDEESAVLVHDEAVSVKISLTSPLLRESPDGGKAEITSSKKSVTGDAALLPREPCLKVRNSNSLNNITKEKQKSIYIDWCEANENYIFLLGIGRAASCQMVPS